MSTNVLKYKVVNQEIIQQEILIKVDWAIRMFSDVITMKDTTIYTHQCISGLSLAMVVANSIKKYRLDDIVVGFPHVLNELIRDTSFLEENIKLCLATEESIKTIYRWLVTIQQQFVEMCFDKNRIKRNVFGEWNDILCN